MDRLLDLRGSRACAADALASSSVFIPVIKPGVGEMAAVAFTAATIFLLRALMLLASPRHDVIFHFSGSAIELFAPVLGDVLLLSSVVFIGLLWSRRRGWAGRLAWSLLLSVLPYALLKNFVSLMNRGLPHWADVSCLGICVASGCVVGFCLNSRDFQRFLSFVQVILFALSFPSILLFLEIAFNGFEARHLNNPPPTFLAARTAATPFRKPRFIWIILDELAYEQASANRPRGTDLPGFDAFGAEATSFTHVSAAAEYTAVAVPSLLTGVRIDSVKASADGGTLWLKPRGHSPVAFNERDTVFSDAVAHGYQVAAAGWYIPYCRILPTVLSKCFWTGPDDVEMTFMGRTVTSRMVYPALSLARSMIANVMLRRPSAELDKQTAAAHIDEYLELSRASDCILQDGRNDFVFLHLPVPHPGGIYDRAARKLAYSSGGYVDNLTLADIYFTHVRQELKDRGEWDDATVLLMGDHSWRAPLWRRQGLWSPAEEVAWRGKYDDRPAYLLKLPNQHVGATLDWSFAAVDTRALVDALLRGQIQRTDQLRQWVSNLPDSPSRTTSGVAQASSN